jgi:hypothetical protein
MLPLASTLLSISMYNPYYFQFWKMQMANIGFIYFERVLVEVDGGKFCGNVSDFLSSSSEILKDYC